MRRVSGPAHAIPQCTPEPGDGLGWRELAERERAEWTMIVNCRDGFSTYHHLEVIDAPYPFRVVGDARLKTAAEADMAPEERERRQKRRAAIEARTRELRAEFAAVSTGDLQVRKNELELQLEVLEEEHTVRWAALEDHAEKARGRFDTLRPAARRGVPLWWIEDDYRGLLGDGTVEQLYAAKRRSHFPEKPRGGST